MKKLLLASAALTAPAAARRGIQAVRADGVNAEEMQKVLENLNKGFQALKAKDEQRDKNIAAKFDDVVTKAEIEKVNADLGKMMEAVDKANAMLAAAQAGAGDGPQLSEDERALNADFDVFARTGEGESKIKAAMQPGGVLADMTVGSDPDGGLTAPVEWDRQITDKLKIVSAMRRFATVQRVSGQGFKHLYNLRGAASGWVGETDARPKTGTPTVAEYAFAFGEIYANPAISQRLLEDSLIDVAGWLADEVDTEFAAKEGVAFLSGDGVNKPKGVLMYDAAAEGALPANQQHPLGPVLETNTGDANGLTPDGLVNLIYDTPTERVSAASRFYMNRKTHAAVRTMKDGQGNFLWQPPYQLGEPAQLLGYGVAELAGMPDVAAAAIPVMFGDMAEAYRIFDRVGVQVLRDPYTNKPYVHFYTRKRVGGGLWNPEWLRYHRVGA